MSHPDLKIASATQSKLRNYLKSFCLLVCLSFLQLRAFAGGVYMQDLNPWGYTQNQTCMNNVFGANWYQANYSTPAASIFIATTSFVMMEGGDDNSGMPAYLSANQTVIENWVAAGGRLFINAAPNYGANQNWGFGGTTLMYADFGGSVTTSVPTNEIFMGPYTPTTTSYTGSYFSHASIIGSGLTSLLYNQSYAADVRPVLAYKAWGTGTVFFGGCTQPNFWSPTTEGVNLWQNIFVLAAAPAVTINCPNNVTSCISVVNNIAPTVTNGSCATITYTLTGATTGVGLSDASGTNFNVGTTIVKYVATSTCGPSDSCSFSVTINPPTGLLAGNTVSPESLTLDITNEVEVRYTDCDLMANIRPVGIDPIHGSTTVKVTVDNATNYFNGQPYLKRHFDIEPAISAGTATAILRINAYQYEFDAYNIAATAAGLPLLPTGTIDNGKVLITQFHGVGTAPGNYTGSEELIMPSVSWDAAHNNWVMEFPVTGFSGFYIHTAWGPDPLAVTISDIKAANKGQENRIDWKTATEATGDVMTLQRSADGSNFTAITEQPARGTASNYTYWDKNPVAGINYYRVKLTDAEGKVTYTNVVNAQLKNTAKVSLAVSPNPVLNSATINITGEQHGAGTLQITDPAGKELLKVAVEGNTKTVDMSSFPSGIYFIRYTDETGSVTSRMVKQ